MKRQRIERTRRSLCPCWCSGRGGVARRETSQTLAAHLNGINDGERMSEDSCMSSTTNRWRSEPEEEYSSIVEHTRKLTHGAQKLCHITHLLLGQIRFLELLKAALHKQPTSDAVRHRGSARERERETYNEDKKAVSCCNCVTISIWL